MALIFPWVPIVFALSSFEYWMQTFREQGLGEKTIISSYTLTKGESWALLRKSALKSTTLAQPFCVNQAVGAGRPATASACPVCRCETMFLLVGTIPSFKTMSVKKSDSYRLFTIIRHWDTQWRKMTSFPKKTAFSFSEWIGVLKTSQGENDGYSWKNYMNCQQISCKNT